MPQEIPLSLTPGDSIVNRYCIDTSYFYPVPAEVSRIKVESSNIFGENSSLNPLITTISQPKIIDQGLSHNTIILNCLTISIFFFYIYIVYRLRDSISSLFKTITNKGHLDSTLAGSSLLYRYFITQMNILGYISIVTILLKIYMVSDFQESIFNNYISLIIIGVIFVMVIYRFLMHTIILRLTNSYDFIKELKLFNNLTFALASIVISFFALFLSYFDKNNRILLFTISAILFIFFSLYYLMKSYRFFSTRNISILQWILYLCGVEILPISFFIFLAIR